MKVVIIPGMGCSPIEHSNWYSWFAWELKKHRSIECVVRDFPDPDHCRESIWMPFLLDKIGIDADTVVVGHSSGAICAMRLLEQMGGTTSTNNDDNAAAVAPMKGAILVSAYHTDLGEASEKLSGYFSRPWRWEKMRKGAEQIVSFHGKDDHLVPVAEARYVAEQLKGNNFEYHEMDHGSHFFDPWPELLQVFDAKFSSSKQK